MKILNKNLLLYVLSFLCVGSLYGQQQNYILSANESGATKNYIARDYISMQPGFTYSALDSNIFSAKIDEKLLFPPTKDTYLTPENTITADPAQGSVVGTIPGQFNVNQSGGATYEIPIECLPGINGMQPNLSFSYNSQRGGSGPLGIGWNISGLSSISCVPENQFSNEKISGLDFTKNAAQYAIDGNILFNSSTVEYGGDGCEYYTENKTYQKINSSGSVMGQTNRLGPSCFVVTTKDGTKIEYGYKVYPGDNANNAPCQWLISKITDNNGNYLTFSYANFNRFQTVLCHVDYTGNLDGHAPSMAINFNYEIKSPVQKSYLAGILFEDAFLLKSVDVSNILNSQQLKRYDFTYNIINEKYYLSKITQTGENNVKLEPTTFTWGDNSTSPNVQVCSVADISAPNSEILSRQFASGDVDGDGFSDIIQIYKKKETFYPGGVKTTTNYVDVHRSGVAGIGSGLIFNDTAPLDYYYDNDLYSENGGLLIGEFNGDRKKTILIPSFKYIEDYGYNFKLTDITTKTTFFGFKLKRGTTMPKVNIGDINNDGIDEIITVENQNFSGEHDIFRIFYLKKQDYSKELALNDSVYMDKFVNVFGAGHMSYSYYGTSKIFVSDFDMDGLKDIMIVTKSKAVVLKNKGGTLDSRGILICQFQQSVVTDLFNSEDSFIKPGDFNGDGLMDFLVNKNSNSVWKLFLNTGNGFTNSVISNMSLIKESFADENDDKDECIVVDLNKDGKSDVILIDAVYKYNHNIFKTWGTYERTDVKWYVSNGTSFTIVKQYSINDSEYFKRNNFSVDDFNGDGYGELFTFDSNLYTGTDATDAGRVYYYNTNHDVNKITDVTYGYNKNKLIRYQLLPYTQAQYGTGAFYTVGTGSTYPYTDIVMPLSCVSLTSQYILNGGGLRNYYTYSGLKAHVSKGLLGFSSMTVSTALSNRKITSSTELDYINCLPLKQTVETAVLGTGEFISRIENQMTNSKIGKVFKSELSKTIETDILGDLNKTTEYLGYDTFGNPTAIRTITGDLTENKAIIYGQYGSWCPNKTTSLTITRQMGSDSFSRTSEYEYDAKGNLTKETVDPADVNKVVKVYKDFDGFGHAKTVEVTANNMTRRSSMEYTPSGRFVQSKTDVQGETINYQWDEIKCLLNSETTRLGTTSYKYNELGRLIETNYPDGIRKVESIQWRSPNNPYFGVFGTYYVYSQISGSSPVYVWYDPLGREVKKESFGLDNRKISVFTEYISDSKVYRVSEPTFNNSAATWAATYTYDSYGRPKTMTTPMGMTTTLYSGRNTTVTSPDGVSIRELNTSGLLQRSEQNSKGVTYTYFASGLPKTTTPDFGQALTMEYDLQGNRIKLIDPDAGTVESQYNGFGEMLWSRQLMHSGQLITTTNTYVPTTGVLQNIIRNGETTMYTYDTNHRISTIEIAGKHKKMFTFGDYDRITKVTEIINNSKTLATETEYDSFGREKKYKFPSGYFVTNTYDSIGNLTEVRDQIGHSIWKPLEENARGQLTRVSRGGRETTFGFESRGLPTSIQCANVVDLSYSFDSKGNLQHRTDTLTNQREQFLYDNQNRLTNWDVYQNAVLLKQNSITYDPNTGNITQKSDLDNLTMNYGENGKPHALSSISGKPAAIPFDTLNVTYTDFKKIATLTEGNKHYTLSYGVDDQRRKSVYSINGAVRQTRYYLGDYEEEIDAAGNIRKIHYLSGGAVYIQNSNSDSLLYGYSDYQGSLIALTDGNGAVLERYAYDPWGQRRNPTNWTQTDARTSWRLNRGYTGHEHLDAFGIINMNGRVYDPLTSMFFSPDPYVQAPDSWLNYNRYGYCYGNPLKYTDPSGEFFFYLIPNIGWDRNGGINIGLTAGLGLPGFGPSISTSYGVQSGNWSVTAGISTGGFNAYAGYGSSSGFMAGYGYNVFGLPGGFSSNMTGFGVNYSQNGALSINVFGMQMTQNGMSFNPSLGYSLNISYSANDIDDPANSTEKFEEIRNYNGSKSAEMNNDLLSDRLLDLYDYKNGDFRSEAQSDAPAGRLLATNGKYWNPKNKNYILGRTYRFQIGNKMFTKMCISPYVVQSNDVDFMAITTHELTHVIQFYNKAYYNVKNYEKAAYKATYDVYMRNGYYNSAFSTMQKAMSLGFWGSYPSIYDVPLPINHFH